MQIYALDSDGSLILADKASKHHDYQCLECQQMIRLRRGLHRKAHYFHVTANRSCRLHSKGMPHLMLQHFLKNVLPDGEVEIECQFPQIARIADVAWHPKRLIYEIQYSPITAEEVKARNASYASIGYQVVWIFHQDRYNKERLSAAEDWLALHPHYFSDMNAEGEGIIYDQFATVVNGRRVQRLPILPIDVSTPKNLSRDRSLVKLPFVFRQRAKAWPLIFGGDTIDCLLQLKEDENYKELRDQIEKLVPPKTQLTLLSLLKNRKLLFRQWVSRPYKALVRLMLERACR